MALAQPPRVDVAKRALPKVGSVVCGLPRHEGLPTWATNVIKSAEPRREDAPSRFLLI